MKNNQPTGTLHSKLQSALPPNPRKEDLEPINFLLRTGTTFKASILETHAWHTSTKFPCFFCCTMSLKVFKARTVIKSYLKVIFSDLRSCSVSCKLSFVNLTGTNRRTLLTKFLQTRTPRISR